MRTTMMRRVSAAAIAVALAMAWHGAARAETVEFKDQADCSIKPTLKNNIIPAGKGTLTFTAPKGTGGCLFRDKAGESPAAWDEKNQTIATKLGAGNTTFELEYDLPTGAMHCLSFDVTLVKPASPNTPGGSRHGDVCNDEKPSP